MPSLELLETKWRNELIHTCYASADDDLFASNISAWICGHSHRSTMWRAQNGMPVYMNARGYNREDELNRITDSYSPRAILKVTLKKMNIIRP